MGRMAEDRVAADRWLRKGEVATALRRDAEAAKRHEQWRSAPGFERRRRAVSTRGFRFISNENRTWRGTAVPREGVAICHNCLREKIKNMGRSTHRLRWPSARRQRRIACRLDLLDIGASSALFLRKQAPRIALEPRTAALEAAQRPRLTRAARRPQDWPGADLRHLMESLAAGIAEGRNRCVSEGSRPLARRPTRRFRSCATCRRPPPCGWVRWLHRSRSGPAARRRRGRGGPATSVRLLRRVSPRKSSG